MSGTVPLTIQFSGSESCGAGGIDTFHWTFGTGDESYETGGTYTYQHAGEYTLTLSVRSGNGTMRTESMKINVLPALWVTDENLDRIYKLDMNGQEILSFPAPAAEPRGIASAVLGGTQWLYVACQGEGIQRLYRVDPSDGSVASEYGAPAQSPVQLAYGADEPERLWHTDALSRKIYELNPNSGAVLGSFGTNYFRSSRQVGDEIFLQTPQGLAWTERVGGAGYLHYLEGETHLLYEITIVPSYDLMAGMQLSIAGDPIEILADVFPVSGMAWLDGYLWVADRDRHRLVQIDPATGLGTGQTISGFPGANIGGLDIQQ